MSKAITSPEYSTNQNIRKMMNQIIESKFLSAKLLINEIKSHGLYENIHDTEFKVFSQFGDDGILQHLVHQTRAEPQIFIDFGIQDYSEANTRFLLINNN